MLEKKDTLIRNGAIYSIGLDGQVKIWEAAVIRGETFIYVGNEADAAKITGSTCDEIDLKGRTMLPAFADSHLHVSSAVELLECCCLYDTVSAETEGRGEIIKAYQAAIKNDLQENPQKNVIRGVGWNPALFLGSREGNPTAKDLDEVCADRPVMLVSYDHHYLWVNSIALEQAGINKQTDDPRNGILERDKEGNPTGIFQETPAIDLFKARHPLGDYTVEEYRRGIDYYQKTFGAPLGTLLTFDASHTENAIHAYTEMAREGKLNMRVRGVYVANPADPMSQIDRIIRRKGRDNVGELFRIDTVKFFIDGSGTSFYLEEPFEEKFIDRFNLPQGYRGYPQWELGELKAAFDKLCRAGFQIHAHCMGDGAVRQALDAFYACREISAQKDLRHTIAHLMLVREPDLRRMAELSIIGAIQPMWCYYDSGNLLEEDVLFGKRRSDGEYPFGKLEKEGVRLTAGTDFPVDLWPNPFIGMKVGATRTIYKTHPEYKRFKGRSLGPSENKMTLKGLLQAYTINSAYQMFLEEKTGTIEAGKSADFVILDSRLSETEAENLDEVKVEQTYFRGECVYRKK